ESVLFFFFQAEDGIRDYKVTGVQTCALPISQGAAKEWDLSVVVPVEDMSELGQPTGELAGSASGAEPRTSIWPAVEARVLDLVRSEERRVGKEWRARWAPCD